MYVCVCVCVCVYVCVSVCVCVCVCVCMYRRKGGARQQPLGVGGESVLVHELTRIDF
jgi:heme/copper-type cytochrome/quinol oxidase subunit 2